ncbi:hypothetical protein MMC12_001186 [Toensbergia leucococca]|nr:hypothetical protein [Toensbergia leucococca]
MNWTGGRLQRSRNAGTALSAVQKKHFAKVRAKSNKRPCTLSDFQFSFAEDDDEGSKLTNSKWMSGQRQDERTQSKLEDFDNNAPLVKRLDSLRPRHGSSNVTRRPLDKLGNQTLSRAVIQCSPSVRIKDSSSTPFSRSTKRARDTEDLQCDNDRSRSERRSHPASQQTLEEKRQALLQQKDWVGLGPTRPVKIVFPDTSDRDLIGKRHPVKKGHHVHGIRPTRKSFKLQSDEFDTPERRRLLSEGYLSENDISIRIGSIIHGSQRTHTDLAATPKASQYSDKSDEMLLDAENGSMVGRSIHASRRNDAFTSSALSSSLSDRLRSFGEAPRPSDKSFTQASDESHLSPQNCTGDGCERPTSRNSDQAAWARMADTEPKNLKVSTSSLAKATALDLANLKSVRRSDGLNLSPLSKATSLDVADILNHATARIAAQNVVPGNVSTALPTASSTTEGNLNKNPAVVNQSETKVEAIVKKDESNISAPQDEDAMWYDFVFGHFREKDEESYEDLALSNNYEHGDSSMLVELDDEGSKSKKGCVVDISSMLAEPGEDNDQGFRLAQSHPVETSSMLAERDVDSYRDLASTTYQSADASSMLADREEDSSQSPASSPNPAIDKLSNLANVSESSPSSLRRTSLNLSHDAFTRDTSLALGAIEYSTDELQRDFTSSSPTPHNLQVRQRILFRKPSPFIGSQAANPPPILLGRAQTGISRKMGADKRRDSRRTWLPGAEEEEIEED